MIDPHLYFPLKFNLQLYKLLFYYNILFIFIIIIEYFIIKSNSQMDIYKKSV